MSDRERLEQYEAMHRQLQEEYRTVCAKLEALRDQGKNKTVTFKTLLARKLTLSDWLAVYKSYGLE